MSNGMTSTSSLEVDEYCETVRAALVDLPGELADDLLEDLPYHLNEVLAEGEGSLRERLGEPAAYAEELRAAAGLDPAAPEAATRAGLAEIVARMAAVASRLDVKTGPLVGYPRLVDLLRALRPGWWVLRGWLVARFICGTPNQAGLRGIIPSLGTSVLAGFCITVVTVAASVWFGGRTRSFSAWPRRAIAVANMVILVWALTRLQANTATVSYVQLDPASGGYSTPDDATDVYVYDRAGNRVDGARLYDQNGNPIQVGPGSCQDGSLAPGVGIGDDGTMRAWTYPLCPADPGPFRAGPGAVPAASATTAPSASPSTPPTVSGHARTTPPTPKATTPPKATTSPTR